MSQTSSARFPDGGAFRIEIPSVEGPEPLAAVLDEVRRYGLTVHRVSQGSGIAMLDDEEIVGMADQCLEANIELCLFLGPRASWDVGSANTPDGRSSGARVRGGTQLRYSIDDAMRAVGLGVKSLLVADEGVLWELHKLRAGGNLPPDLTLKMSALSGPVNPSSFAVIQYLGADSINVASDLSVEQLHELRLAGGAAIDFYLEAPEGLGGFVRHHDAPAVVRAAAPVYLKFGLRNSPELYPAGVHLRDAAIATARERVRRAHLAMDLLARNGMQGEISPPGSRAIGPLPRFALPAQVSSPPRVGLAAET